MALGLFEPMSGRMLSDLLRDLREEADKARVSAYDYRQHFFEGGEKTKQYLVQHAAEKIGPWKERRARFSDCGVTSRAAGSLIASLVGHEIKREIEGGSDADKKAIEKVYTDSRMASRQRMFGQNQIVCGDAFAFIAWSDRLGMLLIHSVDPGNMDVFPHPDDPMREGMVIEHRIDTRDKDGKAQIHWVWTDEWKNLVDDDGIELDQGDGSRGPQTNSYGVIPYPHCAGLPLSESYWGRSPVAATIEIHRAANNLRSQGDRLVLMEAHKQFVISDNGFDEKIVTSESNAIILTEGGSAAYIGGNPEGIAAVEAIYQRNIDEAFALVGMPMSIIRGGEVPSGYAMAVAFQGKAEIVNDLAVEYRAFEEELLRKVCIIGAVHGLKLPKDPVPDIDLNVEVFPADRMAQREQDRLDWQAGVMTTEDYVTRWMLPKGATPEAIAEYVRKVNEQEAQKAAQSNPFGPPAVNVPPDERPGLLA